LTEIKTQYQRLRFHDISGDMFPGVEERSLDSIGKVINGLTYSPSDINEKGILVFRSSNVKDRSLKFDDNVYVSVQEGSYIPLIEGDILICVRNGSKRLLGKNALIDNEHAGLAFGAFMAVYRSIYYPFVFHYFDTQQYKKEVHRNLGATINSINGSDLRKLKIPFPSLPEQQKIATFLSAVDKKIQQLHRKNELLEQYKKGVMQKIFSQEIRFKEDQGQDYPDWIEKKLNQITEPIKRRSEKPINEILTISAGKGFLHQKDRFSQVIAGSSLERYTLLRANEFSYNRGNSKSYTYGCIYKLTDHKEALVPNIYRSFSLLEGNPNFYEQLFIAKYLDRQLRRLISSSARMDGLLNIGQHGFYNCIVPFPCLREQKVIGSFLNNLDIKIAATNNQLLQSRDFKKGLLQQMFV
jgi:type I restriction enzyme, S subunit